MWCKIRDLLVPLILNENALRGICGVAKLNEETSKIVASAIMDVKYFVDTKDKRYINQAIDELQNLLNNRR